MTRPTITAATYGLNSAEYVSDCIGSLSWADEVLYVDGGSADDTRDRARAAGAKVLENPWTGFRDQLTFISKAAASDWVLILDVDERATPALADEVRRTAAAPRFDGYYLPRRTRYLGRWLAHGEWFPDYTPRLYRRGKGRYVGEPHARLVVDGPMGRLREPIRHLGYKDLSEQMRKIELYSDWEARELLGKGTRGAAARALFHPPARFVKGYIVKAGFLDGWPGFVVAVMTAYHVFVKYVKLRELNGGRERCSNT